MPGHRIYLDYNATAPLAPGVRDAVCAALDLPGNPSSVHREGRAARAAIETARQQVAALVGAPARRVIFTSGATEAAALALTPDVAWDNARGCARLLVAGGEHPCVSNGGRFDGSAVGTVRLDPDGVIDLSALERALDAEPGRPAMLALQRANNETGVLQPVRAAADMVRARGGVVVCDAVQSMHRIEEAATDLGADALFLSAHKMGGPKGAGALVLVNPTLEIGAPLLRGGGQELGLRAGTENVAAIVGFGVAAAHALAMRHAESRRLLQLRDAFEKGLRALFPQVTIFGARAPRLPNTSAFALAGLPAETLLIALDLEGIALSSGSACSSGKVRSSQVLENMGVAPDLARCALRVSVGPGTREDDIDDALGALARVAQAISVRRMQPAA